MLQRIVLAASILVLSRAAKFTQTIDWLYENYGDCGEGFKHCRPHPLYDNKCIPEKWFCDGDNDCGDFYDEEDCEKKELTCAEKHFKCDQICLPEVSPLRCNGQKDCTDGNDELNCTETATQIEDCRAIGRWPCGKGICINVTQICDKKLDCPDGRDEPYQCPYKKDCYKQGLWPCPEGKCIEIWQICDGVPHCENATDEKDICAGHEKTTTTTTTTTPRPSLPIFGCPDDNMIWCSTSYNCINKSQVCDGHKDCHRGEDEFACEEKSDQQSVLTCIEKCLGVEASNNCATTTTTTTTTTAQPSTFTTARPAPLLTCKSGTDLVCGKCLEIKVFPTKTWQEAQQSCSDKLGWLFEIDDADCFLELLDHLKEKKLDQFAYWTGANDIVSEGVWVWSHSRKDVPRGTPMWSVWKNFTNFVQEPQGGRLENCGSLEDCPSQYLNDKPCSESLSYLCETNALAIPIRSYYS